MKSTLALLLITFTGATACTDSATAPRNYIPRAATIASNPPPPPVTGELSGSFSVPLSDESAISSSLSSLRLDIAPSATVLHHMFSRTAVYDKDLETGISSIRTHSTVGLWVSDAGSAVGHGTLRDVDQSGNVWTLNLAQVHSPSAVHLLTCPSDTENNYFCVELSQAVTASVHRFRGVDATGKKIYDLPLHSNPSALSFAWLLPPS